MSKRDQYARQAEGWSEASYADVRAYLDHRADLVVSLGVRLQPGETVLDLACGDGGLAPFLRARGLGYRGVDAEPAMVAAATRLLGEASPVELGDLNAYAPPEPVACTVLFRALYYADDRTSLFRRTREHTTRKLVFDLDPRRFSIEAVLDELRRAGYQRTAVRPFLLPQTRRLPRAAVTALKAAERSGPFARALLRVRFTYLVAGVVEA
ncbi:MAG: class I SAM-dependent methyltransferase [Gaiella sp.]